MDDRNRRDVLLNAAARLVDSLDTARAAPNFAGWAFIIGLSLLDGIVVIMGFDIDALDDPIVAQVVKPVMAHNDYSLRLIDSRLARYRLIYAQ